MTNLPITRMTLYKHGIGYYVRRGPIDGESLRLTLRREQMDDLLKSLTVIDHGGGQVHGVDYDTPWNKLPKKHQDLILMRSRKTVISKIVVTKTVSTSLTGPRPHSRTST